jgi:hypothetical protein
MYFAFGASQLRRLQAGVLVLLGCICIVLGGSGLHHLGAAWSEIFNRAYLTTKVTRLLSQPPKQTYTRRTLYFHALANQMRDRLLQGQSYSTRGRRGPAAR